MFRSPNPRYTLIIFTLILILSGCTLRRDDEATEPLSNGLPPTLAPLGSESSEVVEEISADPTALGVDATATTSIGQAAPATTTEDAVPTTQPAVELSNNNTVVTENASEAAVEPETFTPPAEQASTTQPLIVDAPTEELPTGGPIAANPPASQTTGSYASDEAAAPIPGSDPAYTVQPGDTLFGLALAYGTSVEDIMQVNDLNSEIIYHGQELVIPGYDGSYTVPSASYASDYAGGGGEYIVSPGETLFSIAANFGTSVQALAIANGLTPPYVIYAGQALTIASMPEGYAPSPPNYQPAPYDNSVAPGYGSHRVAPGETLFSIAQQYGVTTQALAAANGLYNVNQIQAGQLLTIP